MERAPRTRTLVATIALLLVAAAVVTAATGAVAGGVAGVTDSVADTPGSTDSGEYGPVAQTAPDGDRSAAATGCFAGDGYPISIGDEGATIDALVHLSVLTDPAVGNEFGVEAAGAVGDDRIVTLAAGVRLTAREAIADGLDPFEAFDILYTYELRLPMFDGTIGDSEYRDEGSPISSAAGVDPC
ncbi:hypothetical protein C461_03857 [Halorubrum aidingense JCM 13560]|uniref:Uncharacterized protein n=1 Tax=Halorubrum aidingense JCM 13560 TaxID=1230454 RepID=M0PF29_9EURY|nr:hypothetical protein [Halorubrum aidingense]EMA68732.1 hypothetical protein C461_03857 [Halorubrum aidingense JCM 13560]